MDNIFYLFGRSSPNKIAREKKLSLTIKKPINPPPYLMLWEQNENG